MDRANLDPADAETGEERYATPGHCEPVPQLEPRRRSTWCGEATKSKARNRARRRIEKATRRAQRRG